MVSWSSPDSRRFHFIFQGLLQFDISPFTQRSPEVSATCGRPRKTESFCQIILIIVSIIHCVYTVCQVLTRVSLVAQMVKKSTCNAGDPSWIPGLERSPGEGIGYPFQYSWASLVAQMVKNLPAMQETWVQSLGWEDPLEEGMATHSSVVAWRIPMDRGTWQATVHGIAVGYY